MKMTKAFCECGPFANKKKPQTLSNNRTHDNLLLKAIFLNTVMCEVVRRDECQYSHIHMVAAKHFARPIKVGTAGKQHRID